MPGAERSLESLLADFEAASRAAEATLERLHAEARGWRAHPRSRSLSQQAEHLADLLGYARNLTESAGYDLARSAPGEPRPASATDLLDRFREATTGTSRLLFGLCEADLESPWTLSREGHPIVTLPRRAALQVFLVNHLRHHVAQLELSLRLAGLP